MLGPSGSKSNGTAQDLSFADQQELLAFIEKRNWFEQKLDSLKALAPVYPFVHPHLVADPKSTAGYVRAGADDSPWRLPDRAQLSAWVSERNALEDEVARFDDGDMDRMKEKTRQMTRVPLTQPSTDLVEVTLDLILLIDQLLTVLRRRGAVLELALHRLQWDDLRHEVGRESDSVHAEIQHVVAEAQAWIPGMPAPERMERRASTKLLTRPPLHSSPSTGSLSESGAMVTITPSTPPTSPGKPPRSPVPPPSPNRRAPSSPTKSTAGGPKSSLHLSILRSQLVGLQSRQRNFAITLVKRSSGILDKMIDSAGRLEGLGGVMGPLDQGTKIKGAVPEELIELQETIEETAGAMHDRVQWCGEFENQCRQAHQHYMSSLHAQHAAGEVLVALEKALTEPASNTQRESLTQKYAEATKALPPVLDAKFPCPSHPEYPSKDDHNERLVQALQATRNSAQDDVDLAGKGLAFYSSMLKAREALLAQHQRVQTLRAQLAKTMEQLERGTASVPRPDVEKVAQEGGNCSEWLSCAASWISTGDEFVRSATDTHQSTMLAAMQYRKALVSAPMAVQKYLPANGVPDDLGPVVDDDTTDLITLARRCADITKSTRTASEAIPVVLCIRQDGDEVTDDIASLQDSIVLAINRAAWSGRSWGEDWPVPEFDGQIAKLSERANDMDCDLQRLKGITRSSAVSQPLTDKVADVRDKISASRHTLQTLARVSDQAKVVLAVQNEAEAILKDINATRDSIPSTKDGRDTTTSISGLRKRTAAWNDTLTQRAVFVSPDPPSLDRSTSRECSDGPLTPPLTPVNGAPAQGTTMPNLVELDGRVRSELNRQSVRVSSALSQLVSAAEDAAFERWAAPVVKATTELDTANDKFGVVMTELNEKMERIKITENEDERKGLAAEAQKSAREILPEPIIEVEQCVAALNEALGGHSSHVDMHRAADVFSSADIARESALGRISESEQWHKDMGRLILEAEVKLQHQRTQLLKQKAQSAQTLSTQRQQQTRSSSALQDAARELVGQLDALDLENVVRPSPVALRTTPKHRRLPSSAAAKKLASQFTKIKNSARSLEGGDKKAVEVETLFNKIKRASTLVPELGGLGAVGDASTACDQAMSRLLEAYDTGDKANIAAAKRHGEETVEAFKQAAKPHRLDQRVVTNQRRIVVAWEDLRSLVDGAPSEKNAPLLSSTSTTGSVRSTASRSSNASRSSAVSRSSTTTSLSSLLSDATVIVPKKKAARSSVGNRVPSSGRNFAMPPPAMPKKPQQSTQSRATPRVASDTPSKPPRSSHSQSSQTPAVSRRQSTERGLEKRSSSESVKSVKSAYTPRTTRSRMSGPFTPSTSKLKPTIPQPFNLSGTPGGLTRSSSASAALNEMATPTRNRGPRMSAPPRTPVLAATPKGSRHPGQGASRLDQAVADVLDTLDVDVPVVPVGRETPEQWQDESGRYWIGTGGKSRLCFCRILRSRTVMVRVGGGWVELSSYLLDRFADALAEMPPRRETMSMSPPDWRRVPLAITSTSLAAAGAGALSTPVRSDGSLPPRTPLRKPLPMFEEGVVTNGSASGSSSFAPFDPSTPSPERFAASLSPMSQSSPLVPIQFMRKASESPSVREKEREREQNRTRTMLVREISRTSD